MSTDLRTPLPSLTEKVRCLKQPQAYPVAPTRIESIETHMSWVFLTDRFAYKLKKPVRYAYLDFSTIEARRHNCEEELRLNRRFAPDVYLRTVALTRDEGGRVTVDGTGEVVDWLVMMRRLQRERMLDYLIRQETLQPAEVREIARLLAGFYHRADPIRTEPDAYTRAFAEEARATRRELSQQQYALPLDLVHRTQDAQLRFTVERASLLGARAAGSRIVEAHGDLRPEHVCLIDARPVVIDCLEFNRNLRLLDPADELAFLAMECDRLGARFVGELIFSTYTEVTGDRPPAPLVAFYKAFRASLRAKLAVWHTNEPDTYPRALWQDRAIAYLHLAQGYAGEFNAHPS